MSRLSSLSMQRRLRRQRFGALGTVSLLLGGLLLSTAVVADPPDSDPDPNQMAPRVRPIPGSTPAVPQPNLNFFAPTNPWMDLGPAPLNVGVAWSGRIVGIAGDPTNANTIFVAAAGGGVWRSTDGGTTYTALTDTQPTLAMGAIAIAPSNHNVVYAGTGEANNSLDSGYGYGVLKSTNGGTTWTLLGSSVFTLATISKIAISSTDPNTVYLAVTRPGMPAGQYAYSGQTGIWKTTDGGSTWTNTTTSISTFDSYSDVAIDPNSGTIYMAVGDNFDSTHNGMYLSTNGGSSWSAAGNFPKGGNDGRISFALSPSTATTKATLYAAIASIQTNGLLAIEKSADGGATWTSLSGVPDYMSGAGWYNNAIAVSPSNASTVFAGGSSNSGSPNLIESTNGGASWSDISSDSSGNSPHTDVHALVFDANGKLLSGTDGGIWRLNNPAPASLSWQDLNGDLETIQFTGISLHPTNKGIAYGGSQDNGTEGYSGSLEWTALIGGDGGHTRVDLTTPTTLYQIFSGGPYIDRSDNSGSTFNPIANGINLSDQSDFYVPYIMDPANTARLLLGTINLYETTSKGGSWTSIGNFSASGAIDAIAVNGNTIYVAAAGSYASVSALYVSTNNGGSWTNVTPSGFSTHIADITVDSTNAQHAFAVADRFSTPHVYTTTNGGSSWSNISGNLQNLPVNAVKYDHTTGIIYIGTDMGIYSSSGNGTWTQFGAGLPNARVVDLDLNTNLGLLGAGTHGRSMWEISTQAGSAPVISSLSPSSATAGGAAFTLTVNGSNFVSGAVVNWNGTALTTTFVSSSQLTASVPASDIAAAGTASVTVSQNGQTSNAATFTINGSAPVISSLSPSSATAGGAAFTLTVNGSNFVSGAVVQWNGTSLTTTFVSSSKLTASVPASDIATAGTASVTVSQNGQTSNAATFTINGSAPVLTSISPASANAGGPAFTLTVKGSSFVNGATVDWNGTALTTTFVSSTQMKATVPAADIAGAGTAHVTVVNPGGGTSASKTFTILVTTLKLVSATLTRNSTTGVYTATVSLKNIGFLTAPTVKITKSSLGAANTSTTLPVTVGNIAAGATATASLTYPSSAGSPGTVVTLKVSGTFTGGTLSGSLKVTLP